MLPEVKAQLDEFDVRTGRHRTCKRCGWYTQWPKFTLTLCKEHSRACYYINAMTCGICEYSVPIEPWIHDLTGCPELTPRITECPHCDRPAVGHALLEYYGTVYSCEMGHTWDRRREDYVPLNEMNSLWKRCGSWHQQQFEEAIDDGKHDLWVPEGAAFMTCRNCWAKWLLITYADDDTKQVTVKKIE